MKLKIANIDNVFDLTKQYWLIIENISFYRKIFDAVINKNDEIIIFYKELFKPENYFKKVHVVYNFFDINLNEKAFLSEFMKQNDFESQSNISELNEEIYHKIKKIMEIINVSAPVNIEFNDQISLEDIFKIIKPVFNCGQNLREKLINYFKILVEFFNIEVIIAFNLNNYFSKEEISEIYDEINQLNISLFVITTNNINFLSQSDIIKICIDNDLCEYD